MKRTRGRPPLENPAYKHPLYVTWQQMKGRCENPRHHKYAAYGARGITVCERWQDFWAFVADMGPKPPRHTLEREDNQGGYDPFNCKWAPAKVQQNNKRSSRTVTHDGETRTIGEWATHLKIPYGILWRRLRDGWSMDRIIDPLRNTPRR